METIAQTISTSDPTMHKVELALPDTSVGRELSLPRACTWYGIATSQGYIHSTASAITSPSYTNVTNSIPGSLPCFRVAIYRSGSTTHRRRQVSGGN